MVKTTFPAQIDQLRPILQWIHAQILPMQFDAPTLRKIELASEEALVNIIHHARPPSVIIEIKLFPKSHLEIAFTDNGPPFNPLQYEPITTGSLEERSIGGLGIHLMKQMMDEVNYQRNSTSNILTLVKRAR